MKYQAIIFDLDGTLWNACGTSAIAGNMVLQKLKIERTPFTKEEIENVAGHSQEECIKLLCPDIPYDFKELSEKFNYYEEAMIQQHGGDIYPNVKELLPKLAEKYPIFIVSNCEEWYLRAFLKFSNLEKFIKDYRWYGYNGNDKKQNIIDIKDKHNLSNALYVGDTLLDQKSSNDSNTDLAAVKYGFGDPKSKINFYSFKQLSNFLHNKSFLDFETDRIILRPFDKTDFEDLHSLLKGPNSLKDTKEYLEMMLISQEENPGLGYWHASLKNDKIFIGLYCLKQLDHTKKIEIGYRLQKEYWEKELETEGSKILVEYGLNKLGLHQIVGIPNP